MTDWLQSGQWQTDYRIQKPNSLPQYGLTFVVQFLVQSFPWGHAEADFSWDHKLTQFSCFALLSQKITFIRIPTSGSASWEPNLRQSGSEQFTVFSISLLEHVLEVAMHRWGSRTKPWSHRVAHWLTPRQSSLCQCSAPEYIHTASRARSVPGWQDNWAHPWWMGT